MHESLFDWIYYQANLTWGGRTMTNKDKTDSYSQLFKMFSIHVENILLRLTLLMITLLICCQALLQVPYLRQLLTRVDAMEGIRYNHQQEQDLDRK
ncbi:hypothetical protein D3C73_683660 [compost metagenome]